MLCFTVPYGVRYRLFIGLLLLNARDRKIAVYSPPSLVDRVIWFGSRWLTAASKHKAVVCFCYKLFTTNTVLVWMQIVIFIRPTTVQRSRSKIQARPVCPVIVNKLVCGCRLTQPVRRCVLTAPMLPRYFLAARELSRLNRASLVFHHYKTTASYLYFAYL